MMTCGRNLSPYPCWEESGSFPSSSLSVLLPCLLSAHFWGGFWRCGRKTSKESKMGQTRELWIPPMEAMLLELLILCGWKLMVVERGHRLPLPTPDSNLGDKGLWSDILTVEWLVTLGPLLSFNTEKWKGRRRGGGEGKQGTGSEDFWDQEG